MAPPYAMQCLEVWGGMRAADDAVAVPGLDAWVFARPHRGEREGGDIHYLSCCNTARIVRLMIADVSGHGGEAAGVARRLRELMRRYMNWSDQRTLVRSMNSAFADDSSHGRFATAVVVTCWTPTDEVTVTNAGHPTPLLYRAASRRWSALSAADDLSRAGRPRRSDAPKPAGGPGRAGASPGPRDGGEADGPRNLPLGIVEAEYDEVRVRLHGGDLLMLYSDALIEARRPGAAGMLGTAGLIDLLNSPGSDAANGRGGTDGASAADGLGADGPTVIPSLVAALRERGFDIAGDDDTTIMVLRANPSKPRLSLAAGVAATARLAGHTVRSVLRGEAAALPEISLRNLAGAFWDGLNRGVKP